jgi:hypothetical protein
VLAVSLTILSYAELIALSIPDDHFFDQCAKDRVRRGGAGSRSIPSSKSSSARSSIITVVAPSGADGIRKSPASNRL